MKLKVVGVNKTFRGKIFALRNINLEVNEGEYVAIVGPSGCGKSTLLKVIMGIVTQDDGKIYVEEKDISNLPPEERNLGFVFQNILLFPHLTAYENIAYSPIVRNFNTKLRDKFVEELFVFGKVDRWRDSYPAQISSRGIQQKIALVRALATGDKILLLDEPLSSLDARVRISLREEVRNIIKHLNITALHVTHDQEEAMAIADKIVLMRSGLIVETGTPDELYYKPTNIFTAFFFGKGNFLPGKVIASSTNRGLIDANGIVFECPTKFKEGDQVVVFFRPENVSFTEQGQNDFSGKIIEKKYIGRYVDYTIECRDRMLFVRSLRNEDQPFDKGMEVPFHIDAENLLVYEYPLGGLGKALSLE